MSAPAPLQLSRLRLTVTEVDLSARRVHRDGGTVRLTDKEAALLSYLAERPSEVVSQGELLEQVWGYRSRVATRAVGATMVRLRAKVERDPSSPEHLLTAWGNGYHFEPAGPPEFDPMSVVPQPVDRFFGRDAELQRVDAAFEQGARLVTVFGPAGIGKTRLVLAHASRSGATTPVVALEHASCADDITRLVGDVLGGHDGLRRASADVTGLIAAMGPKTLVLDNVEQVVAVVAELVAGWLHAAPDARVLCTSRTPLAIGGEVTLELGPLLPDDGEALFVDRARGRFCVAAGADRIRAIVDRLEAVPLAVELAAGLTDGTEPDDLDSSLGELLDRLVSAGGERPDRHESLRIAVEGAYHALSEREQQAIELCSVFRGGMSVEAAEAVLAVDPPDALLLLRALRRKSMLRPIGGAGSRLAPYESVRLLASERLDARGTAREARSRHREWCTDQARARLGKGGSAPEGAALAWLRQERENLLQAFDIAVHSAPTDAAWLSLALFPLLSWDGQVDRSSELLERATVATEGVEPSLGSKVRRCAASAALMAGRPQAARRHAKAAVDLARESGAMESLGHAMTSAGAVEFRLSNNEEALRYFREALQLSRAIGDDLGVARLLGNIGAVLWTMDQREDALEAQTEAIELHRRLESAHATAVALANLAEMELDLGRPENARAALAEGLDLLHGDGLGRDEALLLCNAARVELDQGRAESALALLAEGESRLGPGGGARLRRHLCLTKALAEWLIGRHDAAVSTARDCPAEAEPPPTSEALISWLAHLDRDGTEPPGHAWREPRCEPGSLAEARQAIGLAFLAIRADPASGPSLLAAWRERYAGLPVGRHDLLPILSELERRVASGDRPGQSVGLTSARPPSRPPDR